MILARKVKGPSPLPAIAKRSKIWLGFVHLVFSQAKQVKRSPSCEETLQLLEYGKQLTVITLSGLEEMCNSENNSVTSLVNSSSPKGQERLKNPHKGQIQE